MHTRTRLIIIAAIGLVAAIALACAGAGGDSGDTSGEEPPSIVGFSGAPDGDAASGRDDGFQPSVSGEALGAGGGISDAPPESPQLAGLLDRKIILTTSVDVGVEDVSRNFQEVIRLADSAGGFVSSSSFSTLDDMQIGDVTIRVPGDQYQSVLADVRAMGEVTEEASDANDATEEYTDLEARLRTLEATEQRYLELLTQADGINDILIVQDRLDVVRGQIEQVQGRVNLLDQLTELATITVHLRPLDGAAAAAGGGSIDPLGAAESAWGYSLDTLRGLAAATLVVVVFSWWLVPAFALIALGARWWMGRRQPQAGPVA